MTITKAETVNDKLTQARTFFNEYFLEIALILCIIAGIQTEYNCYVAGMSPFWGLTWLLPMAGLHYFYHHRK